MARLRVPPAVSVNRRFPRHPLVGVGALVFRDQRVLLVQRGREPGYGLWSLPGGLVELGERLDQAIEREVLEESGIQVQVLDLAAALDRVIRTDDGRVEYHYVLLDFVCRCRSDTEQPQASSDALAGAFVPLADLDSYPMTAGTQEVIRRAWASNRGQSPKPLYRPCA